MNNVTNDNGLLFNLTGEGTPRFVLQHFNGDVTIEGWDRPAIAVRTDDDEDTAELADVLAAEQRDNEVRLNLELGRRGGRRDKRRGDEDADEFGSGWHGLRQALRHLGHGFQLDLHIAVPYTCDITLRTMNGDVEIRRVQGKLYIENATGDMEMEDIRGNVLIKSASADVEISRLQGRLGIQTASGDLSVQESELSALSVRTASGDVEITAALHPGEDYEVQTVSGDVSLNIPRETRAQIEFETISGDFECELPNRMEKRGRRHRMVELNGGGGSRVRIRTTSGDVSIDSWLAGQVPAVGAAVPGEAEGEGPAPTRRFTGGEVAEAGAAMAGEGEQFRAEGGQASGEAADGAPTQRLHKSAEMSILEAIESGEMSVDEGLRRLNELAQ